MTNPELFEQYLEGRSNPEEKLAFEQRLREDAAFAREFELYQTMNADMEQWQQTETERQQLQQTLNRVTGSKKAKVVPLRWYLLRVAALLIVVMLIWKLVPFGGGTNDEKLYKEYIADEQVSYSRGADVNVDSLWAPVSAHFREERYEAAIRPLQQIIDEGKDSLREAAAYLGFCYMVTGQHDKAESILYQAAREPGKATGHANFYRALLYLKTERKERSRKLLDSVIASSGTYYRQRAQELAAKLK